MMYLTHIIAFFLGFISLPLLGYFYNVIQEKKRHDKRVKIIEEMPPAEVRKLFGNLNISSIVMERIDDEAILRNELQKAIDDEDYEKCAQLEKKLRKLRNGEER